MYFLGSISLFLIALTVSFGLVQHTQNLNDPKRCLATESINSQCKTAVIKTSLNKEEFQRSLEQYKNEEFQIRDETVLEAIKVPEKLLAIIEVISQKDNYKGLEFSKKLNDLSEKELRQLYKTLEKAKNKNDITLYHLKKWVQKIYRLTHAQPKFFNSLKIDGTIRTALSKIQDHKIQERLELELVSEGLSSAFSVVIKEPGLRIKFMETLAANAGWLDSVFVFSIWAAGSAYVPADVSAMTNLLSKMPPLLPSFDQFLKSEITNETLQTLKEKGLQAGVESLKTSEEKKINIKRNWGYLRAVYTSVFTVLMAASLHQDIQSAQGKMILESLLGKIVERNKIEEMPLEQRFEILDWRPYMEELRNAGNKMDENSRPIQNLKNERRKMFIEAMELRKKAQQ